MKIVKQALCPERVRNTPEQFSWVDQALVQHHLIDRCSSHSAALYLFLVTVADCEGLSYYASATLAGRLHLSEAELALPFTHNYFHPELAEASANPAHIICKQA